MALVPVFSSGRAWLWSGFFLRLSIPLLIRPMRRRFRQLATEPPLGAIINTSRTQSETRRYHQSALFTRGSRLGAIAESLPLTLPDGRRRRDTCRLGPWMRLLLYCTRMATPHLGAVSRALTPSLRPSYWGLGQDSVYSSLAHRANPLAGRTASPPSGDSTSMTSMMPAARLQTAAWLRSRLAKSIPRHTELRRKLGCPISVVSPRHQPSGTGDACLVLALVTYQTT
jgi:hypothetical protein